MRSNTDCEALFGMRDWAAVAHSLNWTLGKVNDFNHTGNPIRNVSERRDVVLWKEKKSIAIKKANLMEIKLLYEAVSALKGWC